MIGLDTNVLLRYIVKDDPGQFARARRVIETHARADDPAWLSLIVTVELVWALRSRYSYTRDEIADTVDLLLNSAEVLLERQHLVVQALSLFQTARVDFADALIMLVNRDNGCDTTVSFDQRLVRAGLAVEP